MGYGPWDCKESDRTERLLHTVLQGRVYTTVNLTVIDKKRFNVIDKKMKSPPLCILLQNVYLESLRRLVRWR